MNILVLIKQVPANLRVNLDSQFNIERDLAENMMNPADKSALNIALELRSTCGGTVSCLTMGPESAADCLREAAIQGADKLFHACDKRLAGADSYVTALVLAHCIRKIGEFDLVLCGQKTIDGETGQVGPELSRMLGYSCLTNITAICPACNGMFSCHRITEQEEQIYHTFLPAVLAVCSMPVSNQLPSLAQLRQARRIPVQKFNAEEIGFPSDFTARALSPTRVVKMHEKATGQRRCQWLRDADDLVLQILNKRLLEMKEGK